MSFRVLAAAASLLALAACGEGSGSSGTTAGGATGGSTSTPTPTPTASYDAVMDFTKDRRFYSQAAEINTALRANPDGSDRTTASFYSSATTVDLAYSASGQSFTLTFQSTPQTYLASQNTFLQADARRYTIPLADGYDQLVLSKFTTTTYVAAGSREVKTGSQDVTRYFLIGPTTLDTDRPTAGTIRYAIRASSSNTTVQAAGNGAGNGTSDDAVRVDYATGAVSGTLHILPTPTSTTDTTPIVTVTITGTFDRTTGRITGTLSETSSGLNGTFSGTVFGPQGQDIAFLYLLRRPSAPDTVGQIYGPKS